MPTFTGYTMSLCSVGIMGISFTRDETVTRYVELAQGENIDLPVPHIYDEFTSIREQEINMRQSSSSQLPFVIIVEETTGQSTIHIDAEGVEIGDYQL